MRRTPAARLAFPLSRALGVRTDPPYRAITTRQAEKDGGRLVAPPVVLGVGSMTTPGLDVAAPVSRREALSIAETGQMTLLRLHPLLYLTPRGPVPLQSRVLC